MKTALSQTTCGWGEFHTVVRDRKWTRKEKPLSKAKMVWAVAFVAALMMVVMAAPAFAFIHTTIPAGQCAAS